MAIKSFSDQITEIFFETGKLSKKAGWQPVKSVAVRKLDMIEFAGKLLDLKSPPGNCLEKLSGNLSGFYSIRINDQWRIVFKWTDFGAEEVKICDYH
jgi:proteic killer suppression protein